MNNNIIEQKTNNYLPLSIISALLGCFSPCFIGIILGVISIFFAVKSNTEGKKGNYVQAQDNAKYAKIFAYIALAIAVINMIYVAYLYQTNPDYFQEMYEMYQQAIEEAQNQ